MHGAALSVELCIERYWPENYICSGIFEYVTGIKMSCEAEWRLADSFPSFHFAMNHKSWNFVLASKQGTYLLASWVIWAEAAAADFWPSSSSSRSRVIDLSKSLMWACQDLRSQSRVIRDVSPSIRKISTKRNNGEKTFHSHAASFWPFQRSI